MTDETEKKDNGTSRQTVDVSQDLMSYFDSVKRKRGFRSYGAYVLSLMELDRKRTLMPEKLGEQQPSDDRLRASGHLRDTLDHLEHSAAEIAGAVRALRELAGGVGSQPGEKAQRLAAVQSKPKKTRRA